MQPTGMSDDRVAITFWSKYKPSKKPAWNSYRADLLGIMECMTLSRDCSSSWYVGNFSDRSERQQSKHWIAGEGALKILVLSLLPLFCILAKPCEISGECYD
jgi:hypothetical protein